MTAGQGEGMNVPRSTALEVQITIEAMLLGYAKA